MRVLTLLSTVVFIAVVNGTMINVALPHIGRDFEATEGVYSWLVTGYSLTFGIFNAINGRLADLWGKRRLYTAGLVVLGLCSLLVAAAPTLGFAIGVRIVQGAGAAALPVLGMTIIKAVVPAQKRGRAIGVILAVVGVAASIGPFLGGLLVQVAGWRAVFVAPSVILLAVPFVLRVLPKHLDDTTEQTFDLVGALMLGSGIALLLYSFNVIQAEGPVAAMWTALGGVLALGAFWVWIGRREAPFVAPTVFAQPGYKIACLLGMVTNAGRFGSVVLAPIFLTQLNDLEPIWVGVVLCPGAVAIALLSARAGSMGDKRGPRLPISIGMVATLLGALVSAVFAGGSLIGVTVGLTLFGVGFAFTQSPLMSAVTRIVPKDYEGVGIGMFMMLFFIGGASGIALCVTITELQGPGSRGVLGLGAAPGAGPFADALVILAVLAAVGLVLTQRLKPSATL